MAHRFSKLQLQERIHLNHCSRDRIKTAINDLEAEIKQALSNEHFERVQSFQKARCDKSMAQIRERHVRKYNSLLERKSTSNNENGLEVDKDRWIINLSNKDLSSSEKSLLSRGLNFGIAPTYIPKKDIIAEVEGKLDYLEKAESISVGDGASIRAEICTILTNSALPKDNISRKERKALTDLRKDNSIKILSADKGRATVILNNSDYIDKCTQHIENGPYKYLKRDPTSKNKRQGLKLIKSLHDLKIISDETYRRIKPADSHAPRFYGLPKIHKEGFPIRPIVSCSGTPLENLSKYIAGVLKQYIKKRGHAKNSKEFSEFIRDIEIEDDEMMISFDVTSLYTNVPIKDSLKIISDLLRKDKDLSKKTPIPVDKLIELIEFDLTTTWFKFNGKFVSQTDGVAMGKPASSVVAEIFMQEKESLALDSYIEKPKVWERYVDDVFVIIKKEKMEDFYNHINSLHVKLKFTTEVEKDGKLAFLDTEVQRKADKSLSVSVYRKPTHTDQYLNAGSHHLDSVKNSVVSSLFNRAKSITSGLEDLDREYKRISSVLQANEYKQDHIRKVTKRMSKPRQNPEVDKEEPICSMNLPYIRGTSEKIRRSLSKQNIRCTFYSLHTLKKSLSRPKDKVDDLEKSNVVYKIPCKDCPKSYIGQSKRETGTRLKEHKANVTHGRYDKSDLAHHCWTENHQMDWDNISVIDEDKNWKNRLVKESIHSVLSTPCINQISYTIPEIWLNNVKSTERNFGATNDRN